MNLTIAYILAELEELEREDRFRLKRVKDKKIEKARVDGAGEKIENIELNEEETTKSEETRELDETAKAQNTIEPEKITRPEKTTKLETESLPDNKAVQPKEAAEMGDLIVIRPPDDRLELVDVFISSTGLKTMATIAEVEKLIKGISEIKTEKLNIKSLKYIQSDDKNLQLVENDVKNDVNNMKTGEWFETPSKFENTKKLNENVSIYSKMEKLKDVVGGDREADTTSEAKMPLKADENITVDDIFSKHDLTIRDSVSVIPILDHSLVDLESIDLSIDSKGKVVVSKLDVFQSTPVLSTQEATVSKLIASNNKDTLLLAPTGRMSSGKWINESKTEEEKCMSQLEDKGVGKLEERDIIEEKFTKDITVFPKLEILGDAEGTKRATDTSAVKMPLKADDSINDLDKKALASLYRDIDSNFYKPTVEDIFSKHDLLAIQDSNSLQDIVILDHSLADLESIDFSIDSKGKVIVSKLKTDPLPLSTQDKDGKFVSPAGRIASVRWVGEGQNKNELLVSQLGNATDSKLADENHELSNQKQTTKVIEEKSVKDIAMCPKLEKLEDISETAADTSAVKVPLKIDGSIIDSDKRALVSLSKDIDSNFYKPTVDDIYSKHDLVIQGSNSLQDVTILDHSLVDLKSIDFSIDSKGKVVVSEHRTGLPLPLSTRGADVSKQKDSYDKDDKLVTLTGRTASIKRLSESQQDRERLVLPLKNENDDQLAKNSIKTNSMAPTGQVGDEKAFDEVKKNNISETFKDSVGDSEIKQKHQESLKNEILTIDININNKNLDIQSNISIEEKEGWTSYIEEIPKNPISGIISLEPVKEDENQKPQWSKIPRSISDEKLSRISEEDYVEQDPSKLGTLVEESKEMQIKEKNETEGSVISDKFEDSKTFFHDSEKSFVNNKKISQQIKIDIEQTKDIKHIESRVFKETEHLYNVSSNLKLNEQQVQSNRYTQHDKHINENKSITETKESGIYYQSKDTSKINEKRESDVENDFMKSESKTKLNVEPSKAIENIESLEIQENHNTEDERSKYTVHGNKTTKEDNMPDVNKTKDTVKQGKIMNNITIAKSLSETNIDGICEEKTVTKQESNDLNMMKEIQAIHDHRENKLLQIKDLEHTKIKDYQRDSKTSIKIEAKRGSQEDKHQMAKYTAEQETTEVENESGNKGSETVEQTKRINRDIHVSKTNDKDVKEVDNKEENYGKVDSGGIIRSDSENRINGKNNETAEQFKRNSQSRAIDESNNRPFRHSDEILKSELENKKNSKNSGTRISRHLIKHSRSKIDVAGLKEAGQKYTQLKVNSREIQDGKRNGSNTENTISESQNYQEDIIKLSNNSQNKENSNIKGGSSNKPLKIHSQESHQTKRDDSIIENTMKTSQNYQEEKIISKDNQVKESLLKELDKNKTHEKLLKLQKSSEIFEKEHDNKRVSKDSENKEYISVKEVSTNELFKIYTPELHEIIRDSSNTENIKRESQNYQEDKRINTNRQDKKGVQKELDVDKRLEKPLKIQISSETISKEQDYERDSKESQSKEGGYSKENNHSRSNAVSDLEGDQKDTQQKSDTDTESRSSNVLVPLERCNLCGTYHKKQD